MPRSRTIVDDFERSDRLLDRFWVQKSPTIFAEIVNGRVQSNGFPYAFYAQAGVNGLPSMPKRIEIQFSLIGTNGPNCGPVILISADGVTEAAGPYRDMIHFVIVPGLWTVNVYEAGVASAIIATGNHTFALDGTVYTAAVRLDGSDTITLELPDGTERAITDSRFSERSGRFVAIEAYAFPGSGQDVVTRFERVEFDVARAAVAPRATVASRASAGVRVAA